MTSTEIKRKYLVAEEQAIDAAKEAYQNALRDLQANCEHNVVLCTRNEIYTYFYVCEDCGIACISEYNSYVRSKGEKSLLSKRHYNVGWTEFAKNTARVKLEGQVW